MDEAIRLEPQNAELRNSRGWIRYLERDFDKATKDYDEALRLDPSHMLAINNRGLVWLDLKHYDRALKAFDEACRLDPKSTLAINNRGLTYHHKKEYEKAIKEFDDAIRLDPNRTMAFANRARSLTKKKEYDKAVKDFQRSVEIEETNWGCCSFAFFRATCPDAKYRDGKAALVLAKKACDLMHNGWKDGHYLSTLAAAYAENLQFDEAVRYQKQAIEDRILHADDGRDFESRLKLYEGRKPYRDE